MSRTKHILSYSIPIVILLFFLFGSFFAPHDPTATNIRGKYLSSSAEYPFGTDDFGRCEFSRILEGGKITLGIVLVGSAIVILLGIVFGILLAKTGRRRNILAESILNAVTAIPPVAYLIIFIGIWGNSIPTMLVALTASLVLRMIKLVKQITQGDFQTVNGYAGTGPYIYDEYVAGQYTTFVRNENYWGEQPYYDKIVAKYIPDNASRVQALKTGEIDLIYGSAELSYEDYNQATAIDGIEGKFAPSGSTVRNIILNFNGNLSDLSVRQALAYAIDKEAISEGLTYGYEPVANTIVPDGTPYSDICGTEDYSYNVDRANQLLDEAGWIMNQSTGIREKNGTPLHVVFTCPTDDSTIGSIATLFQSQLAEVGIEVEIKSMEKMEWYASYMNPAGWDITAMTAGFFNYAMPQCWFSAMMAQMPEDVSISLLDNSDEFISALSEFKTCNDDARLKELFELLINTDLDQVLDVPLTHQMDMIVYNTDKIADYNFASDYAFLDVTQITPAE